MAWDWIDIQALPSLATGQKLVLFGAGNGSRELLDHLHQSGSEAQVIAVLDNDPSMHGSTFESIPIHAPQSAPSLGADLILITTVSGRDQVARQLEAMGLAKDADFVCIGTYPRHGSVEYLTLLTALCRQAAVPLGRVLHIGPGGFLGLECGLLALFGDQITSMTSLDAYSFNSTFPAPAHEQPNYDRLKAATLALAAEYDMDVDVVAANWDGVFRPGQSGPELDTARLQLLMPHRYSSLPVADASQDLVCSFEVLEHVRDPQQAIAETWRVLASGGCAVQVITTADHRSFGTVPGYTPLTYRTHSETEWQTITAEKFYQNRLAPFQWKELFESHGFTIADYQVRRSYVPSSDELNRLHPDFREWPHERQCEVDCIIVAAKP